MSRIARKLTQALAEIQALFREDRPKMEEALDLLVNL